MQHTTGAGRTSETVVPGLDELVARARRLAADGERRVLGIAGAPGGGKSTVASALVAALGAEAVLVPMDGFHLANAELRRLGRADRKGAPDTFDAAGYTALLRRLRARGPEVVYAPTFDRHLEESIAGAVPVPPEVPLVVTEGNYLLHEGHGWAPVRAELDEVWFVDVDDDLRVERLIARHVEHGRTPEAAREWVLRSDEANARLVAGTRERADLVVRL
ncbi:nucleoside/nucleotide kinase family protein [Cellulomonas endometrii]|uniref:nucleoside/nucleotide kinase family protein n=1 Tax=Cellulomonas endometrii TaxID=3036301 RepID=UPI003D156352